MELGKKGIYFNFCFLVPKKVALNSRGTGKQRLNFEGNKDNIGNREHKKIFCKEQGNKPIYFRRPRKQVPLGRASHILQEIS